MGLFSNQIKTYVSSSVYNLAGDEDLRPQFLRTVIVGSAINGHKAGIGITLLQSMLGGAGMNQRKFFRWARDNYALGMPKGTLDNSATVSATAVKAGLTPLLGLTASQSLQLLSSSVDTVDVDYWARFWVLQNYPTLSEADWSADFDPVNSTIKVKMTINGVVTNASFAAPADYLWGMSQAAGTRRLLFVLYSIVTTDAAGTASVGSPVLYTYRMGTGNVVFDAMQQTPSNRSEFFPVLPLRMNNKSIRHADLATTYAAVKPAFKKLTKTKVDTLLDQIEESDSIGDLDYCFLVHGVSLNSKENDAKRYLYKFFQQLMADQLSTKAVFDTFKSTEQVDKNNVVQLNRWLTNNSAASKADPNRVHLAGGALPTAGLAGLKAPLASELRVYSQEVPEYDHRLTWNYIDEAQFAGNGKTFDGVTTRGKMKVGDFWFFVAPDIVRGGLQGSVTQVSFVAKALYNSTHFERIYLFHQHSAYAYSRLEIVGLKHSNLVYKGKSVVISAKKALETVGEESGFLVPLHYPTLSQMGMLRSTQLATSSTYLLFNSYVQKTIHWWQRGIFKIILVIASAALSVIFPPAGIGLTAGGILGANVAIGAALGFGTAMAGAIAGAVANALASMILTTLIQAGATKIFGDKLGAILGTLISFVAFNYAKAFASTGSFQVDWGKILRAENIMKLTDSVMGAYGAWINADTVDIYSKIDGLADKYEDKFQAVEDASKEMLGMTASLIDPMMLTEAAEHFGESSEQFYSRTMLTGEEIAELSQNMVYEFAAMSLELPTLRA